MVSEAVNQNAPKRRAPKVRKVVELRCPSCRKFLAEAVDYARVRCQGCGSFTTYEPPRQWREHNVEPQ